MKPILKSKNIFLRTTTPIIVSFGEVFKYQYSQMAKKLLNSLPWLQKFQNVSTLRWQKLHLNSPPWLQKFQNVSTLRWQKLHVNSLTWLKKPSNISTIRWLKLHVPWLEKFQNICTVMWLKCTIITLKFSTMVREILEYKYSHVTKMH